MSLCGICHGKIDDGEPFDEEHLSYDGCEEPYVSDDERVYKQFSHKK